MTKKLDKKHILVVDDDQKIKELISQYLIEQNFIVTTAESYAEAKDRMELFSFMFLSKPFLHVYKDNRRRFLENLNGVSYLYHKSPCLSFVVRQKD